MTKSLADSIFVPIQTVQEPVLSIRRVVEFQCVSGETGWTLTPQLMGPGKVVQRGWLIEVNHPRYEDRQVRETYPLAFLEANRILRELGIPREIPIAADDWVIGMDGSLDSLATYCA